MIRTFCRPGALGLWLLAACGCGGGTDERTTTPEPPGGATADAPDSPFETDAADAPPGSAAPQDGGENPADDPSGADNGPELQRPTGEGRDTAAVAGFWDYTRTRGSDTDIVLFTIGTDGLVTEYDYQGDAFGSGADCHLVVTAAIASRGEDRYDIQDASTLPGSTSIDDVLITADESSITFRYLGSVSDPALGPELGPELGPAPDGGMSGITEIYPAVTDRRPAELEACTA